MQSTITYQDLYNSLFNWIKNNCNNIDNYSSNVPAAAKSGWSTTIKNAGGGTPSTGAAAGGGISLAVDSSVIPVISSTTVNNELTNYLNSIGIMGKAAEVVTTNGIISFWNAAANFCSGKLVFISGQYVYTPLLMYKSSGSIPSSSITLVNNEKITASSINNMLTVFNNAVMGGVRAHKINYTVTAVSSCSCSSSCSSSSSSCSSSSSVFIGYIKI
mgnify:CR=1 FL=1